jgi:Arc/MetJ-type ribon-helix-helix transcriptional regulator
MTKKIAVSLPDGTLERARAAVRRGKAPNLSNYIAALIDHQAATESFEEMIADWLRKSGATEAEIRDLERRTLADFEGSGLVPKARGRAAAARKVG